MLVSGLNRSRIPLRTQRGLARRSVWSSGQHKERLVILGSGWGGYGLLRGVDRSRYGKLSVYSTMHIY